MIFPVAIYTLLAQQPSNVSLTVDGNTLLWGILTGMVVIIAFFINRYLSKNDEAFKELEAKVDRGFEKFDERMDKFERNQVRLMAGLKIKGEE